MFSFSDIDSGLLFVHVFDVAVFKDVLYKINNKFNDEVGPALTNIQWSIQFTLSAEL